MIYHDFLMIFSIETANIPFNMGIIGSQSIGITWDQSQPAMARLKGFQLVMGLPPIAGWFRENPI